MRENQKVLENKNYKIEDEYKSMFKILFFRTINQYINSTRKTLTIIIRKR